MPTEGATEGSTGPPHSSSIAFSLRVRTIDGSQQFHEIDVCGTTKIQTPRHLASAVEKKCFGGGEHDAYEASLASPYIALTVVLARRGR